MVAHRPIAPRPCALHRISRRTSPRGGSDQSPDGVIVTSAALLAGIDSDSEPPRPDSAGRGEVGLHPPGGARLPRRRASRRRWHRPRARSDAGSCRARRAPWISSATRAGLSPVGRGSPAAARRLPSGPRNAWAVSSEPGAHGRRQHAGPLSCVRQQQRVPLGVGVQRPAFSAPAGCRSSGGRGGCGSRPRPAPPSSPGRCSRRPTAPRRTCCSRPAAPMQETLLVSSSTSGVFAVRWMSARALSITVSSSLTCGLSSWVMRRFVAAFRSAGSSGR